ncbi:hypothetical protein J3E07_001433 [Methanococcus voltae]|uniref:Transglutaminase-like domain-containing protein n=1 Tax=Methanococcus voltae TaxID=2188 RepID=A0A8J7S5X6_METVO|nr:hypothetical protein [Methanococcus voltae]MBP2201993.1 hypothetical protein [Methanococcus voltae]
MNLKNLILLSLVSLLAIFLLLNPTIAEENQNQNQNQTFDETFNEAFNETHTYMAEYEINKSEYLQKTRINPTMKPIEDANFEGLHNFTNIRGYLSQKPFIMSNYTFNYYITGIYEGNFSQNETFNRDLLHYSMLSYMFNTNYDSESFIKGLRFQADLRPNRHYNITNSNNTNKSLMALPSSNTNSSLFDSGQYTVIDVSGYCGKLNESRIPESLTLNLKSNIIKDGESLPIYGKTTGNPDKLYINISNQNIDREIYYKVPVTNNNYDENLAIHTLPFGDYMITAMLPQGIYKVSKFKKVRDTETGYYLGIYDNKNDEVYSNDQNGDYKMSDDSIIEYYELNYENLTYNPSIHYLKNYTWNYGSKNHTIELIIPEVMYRYYQSKPHNQEFNYAQYALSDNDRKFVKYLSNKFNNIAIENNYSEYDTVLLITTFVQSLKYTSDNVTTGYDEYPRYPVETLVDEGGDCEDTSIIISAILNDLGYDVMVIEFKDHMGVAVKCNGMYTGTYYTYKNNRYYYVETTGENWNIGELPEKYMQEDALVIPLVQIPRMNFDFYANLTKTDTLYVYYNLVCDIENVGSGTAENPELYIMIYNNKNELLEDYHLYIDNNYPEDSKGYAILNIKVPKYNTAYLKCILYGNNFEPVVLYSNEFRT